MIFKIANYLFWVLNSKRVIKPSTFKLFSRKVAIAMCEVLFPEAIITRRGQSTLYALAEKNNLRLKPLNFSTTWATLSKPSLLQIFLASSLTFKTYISSLLENVAMVAWDAFSENMPFGATTKPPSLSAARNGREIFFQSEMGLFSGTLCPEGVQFTNTSTLSDTHISVSDSGTIPETCLTNDRSSGDDFFGSIVAVA